MTKKQFIIELKERLSALPSGEVEERLNFYSEMIDDNIEEGLLEEDAVRKIGLVDDIANQIIGERSLVKAEKKVENNKKVKKASNIALLIIGSPVWLAILISIFAVAFSLYVSAWAVVVSLWAAAFSIAVASVAGLFVGLIFVFIKGFTGLAMIGSAIVCAGLTIFGAFGCKALTKFMIKFTKYSCAFIKNRFSKKEVA